MEPKSVNELLEMECSSAQNHLEVKMWDIISIAQLNLA